MGRMKQFLSPWPPSLEELRDLDEKQALFHRAAVRNRYGKDATAEPFLEEIGVSPWGPRVSMVPEIKSDQVKPGFVALGAYRPKSQKIYMRQDLSPWEHLSTLMHEGAHLADDVLLDQNGKEAAHHASFENFDVEMPASMEAQRMIEQGVPVDPKLLGRFPWLKRVNPRSSNPLASPWMDLKPF